MKFFTGLLFLILAASISAQPSDRNLFIIKLNQTGVQSEDFDFLCLIPAATHINNGKPAVLAIADTGKLTTDMYVKNYLSRFKAQTAYTVNFTASVPFVTKISNINATSRVALSQTIARSFWQSAKSVVVAKEGDYSNCLQASALAAHLRVPLLYTDQTSTADVNLLIKQLGVQVVIVMGTTSNVLQVATKNLTGPTDVLNYLKANKDSTNYFTTTNPGDVSIIDGPKLSLIAPLIAARHGGIVIPLLKTTSAAAISGELNGYYTALGTNPRYLALIGSSGAIPFFYEKYGIIHPESPTSIATDFYYSNVDADAFPDIAIGRIVANDVFDASLYATRSNTYEQLIDSKWSQKIVETGLWKSSFTVELFKNYGFKEEQQLIGQDLKAYSSIDASVILHSSHSAEWTLGDAFDMNSENILSPSLVLSEGCGVTGIDSDPNNLIAKRLARLGIVAFVGAPREATAAGAQVLVAMTNRLLEGQTIGEAFKEGITSMTVTLLDEPSNGNLYYSRLNNMLIGDPALTISIPKLPTISPAKSTAESGILTVTVPKTVFTDSMNNALKSEWKWTADIIYGSCPGIDTKSYWGGSYNVAEHYYMAGFTTKGTVTSITQLKNFPAPLGMVGKYAIDDQQDGTKRVLWNVRVLDFNIATGLITSKIDTIKFKYVTTDEATAMNFQLEKSNSVHLSNGLYKVGVDQIYLDKRYSGKTLAIGIYDLRGKMVGHAVVNKIQLSMKKDFGLMTGVRFVQVKVVR